MTLSDLVLHLQSLDLDSIARATLDEQAQRLCDLAQEALDVLPGGQHDHPWRRTGTLHDSVSAQAEGDEACIGSTSPIALYQEHGTAALPPRPTFGPLAAAEGEAVARSIADRLMSALRSQ
jgi:hypothetical protein